MAKIQLNDVLKKHLKIVGYLLVSGLGGYALAELTRRPELAVVFTPTINYILYFLEKELKNEGVRAALQ